MRTAGVALDSRRDPLTESCLEDVPKSTQDPSFGNEFPLSLQLSSRWEATQSGPKYPGSIRFTSR